VEYFDNRDGWWDKYIENIGRVGYLTANNRPHWQCTICKHLYRSHDVGNIRHHVYTAHERPKKIEMQGFYAMNDSGGG
jgi:hypothetical protein